MRSHVVVVAHRDRLPRIQCSGGVAARHTARDTVHLVSAAATPLGGDILDIDLVVEPGARLRLRSAAAAVALPSAVSRTSRVRCRIEVAGALDLDLQPTVVAADARHLCEIAVHLHEAGHVRLRERVQIGRSGERDGFWSGLLQVDRDGRPVLCHRVELGAGSVADDVVCAPRAGSSELCFPATACTATMPAESTVLALADGGTLTVWQGQRLKT
jgi:urease accessory protein